MNKLFFIAAAAVLTFSHVSFAQQLQSTDQSNSVAKWMNGSQLNSTMQSSYEEAAEILETWDRSNGFTPTYFGVVLGKSKSGKSTYVHACLALAFFKEDGKLHYAHKMWPLKKDSNGKSSCDYDNYKTRVSDNATACVADTHRKGRFTTRAMTPYNIFAGTPFEHVEEEDLPDLFRQVDVSTRKAGQFGPCPIEKLHDKVYAAAGKYWGKAGLRGVEITYDSAGNPDRFQMHTTYPLVYSVYLKYSNTFDYEPPADSQYGRYW